MAWLESVVGAITGVSAVASKILERVWGDQTRAEARLEADGDAALERAHQAQSAAELNAADAELQRVRAAAAARKLKP